MPEFAPLDIPEDGKLSENITWFSRALRAAGVALGPGRVLDAIRAVEAAGFSERQNFYHTLAACFISRPEQRLVFDQTFRLFWRDPRYLDHMIAYMSPAIRGVQEERKVRSAEKRAAEALLNGVKRDMPEMPEQLGGDEIEIDASRTMSREEKLKTLDFEQMSTSEMAEAKRMLAKLSLPVKPQRCRRRFLSPLGRQIDAHATLRAAMRSGGELRDFSKKNRRVRWPNLVALCDISGSMSQYSRALLHFLHAVSNEKGQGWSKVHAFTFGTRVTNITRHLRTRDVDAALAAAGKEAQDWEGGTRIGACLHAFNRDWSRRVMGQGAVVLLVTDGLDRGDPDVLEQEMERLRLSARQVIWLNPLLRWDGFAPKAKGIAAILPRVDMFRAGHNIAALEGLAEALARPTDSGEKARLMAML